MENRDFFYKIFESKYGDKKNVNNLTRNLDNYYKHLEFPKVLKQEIQIEIINFIGYSCLPESNKILKNLHEDVKLHEILDKDFKNEIRKLIKKYRSKFSTNYSHLYFDLIQIKLLNQLDELCEENPVDLPEAVKVELNKFLVKSKRGRPKSEGYDFFIYSLYKLISEENKAYMAILLKTLDLIKEQIPELLNDYEINENSVRTKLSKIKKSPLNKIYPRIWDFN